MRSDDTAVMHVFRSVVVCTTMTLAACASHEDPPEPQCVPVDKACTPAFDPTFDNLFQRTFSQSCALAGPSCHASAGAKAGLVLENPDEAYRLLHENGRVIPGNPECSLVVRKTQSTDVSFQMPPGLPLPPGERCAIVRWVANGAPR